MLSHLNSVLWLFMTLSNFLSDVLKYVIVGWATAAADSLSVLTCSCVVRIVFYSPHFLWVIWWRKYVVCSCHSGAVPGRFGHVEPGIFILNLCILKICWDSNFRRCAGQQGGNDFQIESCVCSVFKQCAVQRELFHRALIPLLQNQCLL